MRQEILFLKKLKESELRWMLPPPFKEKEEALNECAFILVSTPQQHLSVIKMRIQRLVALLPLAYAATTTTTRVIGARAASTCSIKPLDKEAAHARAAVWSGKSVFGGDVIDWSEAGRAPNVGVKDVMFVRHAEGFHNKAAAEIEDYFTTDKHAADEWIDARLTPLGIQQSEALSKDLAAKPPPDEIIVSPLSRAIQTALLAYPNYTSPFVASELCRERVSVFSCDRRQAISQLLPEFGSRIDFSLIESDDDILWNAEKENLPHGLDADKCYERAEEFLNFLFERENAKSIAVFSHWVFLKHLFTLVGLEDFRLGNAQAVTLRLFLK